MPKGHPENEEAIKIAIIRELFKRKKIETGVLLANECSLANFGRRIDLAIIGKKLIGIEIKSRFDNLDRLEGQLRAYEKLFDEIYLVVAKKHVGAVASKIPAYVSLWTFHSNGAIKLNKRGLNIRNQSALELASTLTYGEMRRALGGSLSRDLQKHQLAKMIAVNGVKYTKSVIKDILSKRHENSSRLFWETALHGQDFFPREIESLSRFKKVRSEAKHRKQARLAFWQAWAEESNFFDRNAA